MGPCIRGFLSTIGAPRLARQHIPIHARLYSIKHVEGTLKRSYLYGPSQRHFYQTVCLIHMDLVPCTSDRMLEKSLSTNSDVIIFDLEDSVPPAPASKQAARDRLEGFLRVGLWEMIEFPSPVIS